MPAMQMRYAAGTKEVLRRFFEGEELNPTDVIVSVSVLPLGAPSLATCNAYFIGTVCFCLCAPPRSTATLHLQLRHMNAKTHVSSMEKKDVYAASCLSISMQCASVQGGKMAAQYDGSVSSEGRSLEFKEVMKTPLLHCEQHPPPPPPNHKPGLITMSLA